MGLNQHQILLIAILGLGINIFCHPGYALTTSVRCQEVHANESRSRDAIKALEKIIRTSGNSIRRKEGPKSFHTNFAVGRGLQEYSQTFGPHFDQELIRMRRSDVILDPGGGDAHLSDSLSTDSSPKYVGVTFELLNRPMEHFSNSIKSGRLKILTGRFFEDIPTDELQSIGKIKMITDLYGVLSYSAHPDLVLKKYLEILSDDGSLFIFGPRMKVGKDFDFLIWLRRVQGIEITTHEFREAGMIEHSYSIKKNGNPIVIPEVELLNSRPDMPPIRNFKYTGASLTLGHTAVKSMNFEP